jgi:hypothetical protein
MGSFVCLECAEPQWELMHSPGLSDYVIGQEVGGKFDAQIVEMQKRFDSPIYDFEYRIKHAMPVLIKPSKDY